ncbi:MAG: GNAT family N-acetyltransferase [Chloroflexi bacterium]|nr:GNAT family N-acetyltransferase [Chloroflexota bacterium]
MSSQQIVIRQATLEDADLIASLRVALMRDLGRLTSMEGESHLKEHVKAFLQRSLPQGTFLSWIAEVDGRPVATVGAELRVSMPHPLNLAGIELYVLNVYTVPGYRRRGVAERLMRALLDYAQTNHAGRITLHASDQGRPLYKKLGFVERLGEMYLYPGNRE